MRGGFPEETGHSMHRPVLPGELPSSVNFLQLCHHLSLQDGRRTEEAHLSSVVQRTRAFAFSSGLTVRTRMFSSPA